MVRPAHASAPGRLRRRGSGFALLEVIVAFALMAIAGTTLFAWVNQSLATANRLKRMEDQAQLSLAAQALVASVNPMQEPSGERDAGSLRVHWRSEPLAPPREGAPGAEGQTLGIWTVGLFVMRVEADDANTGASASFDLTQVGTLARPGALQELETLRGRR